MKEKLKKLPRFKSEDAEREFWATHDSADYVDWSKARLTIFPNLRPSKLIMENYYDIVILPSAEVRDFAIAQSRAIHRHVGSVLVLEKRSYKPHISLYHVAVKKNNVAEMIRRLRAIIRGQKAIGSLSVQRYENQPHLAVSKIAWLAQLHQAVLVAINPLRDKRFPNTWKNNWATYGMTVRAIHLKNIRNYGSPVVDTIFDPHITLTVLNDVSDSVKAINLIPKTTYRFTPTAITICQIGPHHSCHRVVATFPFLN